MIQFDGVGQFLDPQTGKVDSILLLKGVRSQQVIRVVVPDEAVAEIVALFNAESEQREDQEEEEEEDDEELEPVREPLRKRLRPTDQSISSSEYSGQVIAQPLVARNEGFEMGDDISEIDAYELERAAFGDVGEL